MAYGLLAMQGRGHILLPAHWQEVVRTDSASDSDGPPI